MDRKQIIISFAVGFVLLTVILVLIGVMTGRKSQVPDAINTADNKTYFANKADIIDGQPILDPAFSMEPGTTVMDLQTRDRKIIPSNKPLPLFPAAASPQVHPDTISREGILKNLYRESNVYYISNNDARNTKPEYYKGFQN
jgi:hypothetical protein